MMSNHNEIPEYLLEEREAMFLEDRRSASRIASGLLLAHPLILDTETTGLDDEAEICEIAVINHLGEVLLDTRVKPVYGISADATRVHGITDADVAGAPTIGEALTEELRSMLNTSTIAIYNADFDLRMLRQSAAARGRFEILSLAQALYHRRLCAMQLYAEFYGDWHEYYQSYTYQSLTNAASQCRLKWQEGAHTALGDAQMTLEVLRYMAAAETASAAREGHDD